MDNANVGKCKHWCFLCSLLDDIHSGIVFFVYKLFETTKHGAIRSLYSIIPEQLFETADRSVTCEKR